MNSLPDETIQAVARSVYARTRAYGFGLVDHMRLATAFLSLCKSGSQGEASAHVPHVAAEAPSLGDLQALPIVSKDLAIRAFDFAGDFPFVERWMHEEYSKYFLSTCANALGADDLPALFLGRRNRFGVVTTLDGTPIGIAGYIDHHPACGRAEMAVYMGVLEARGKGIGAEAAALWLRYGRSGLNLRKVYAYVLDTDVRSAELYRRLGFTPEGIFAQDVDSDSGWGNTVRLARLLS